MTTPGIFDVESRCGRCQHPAQTHYDAIGGDKVHRIFCAECPPDRVRMVGDEGVDYPMPFFVEGRIGADPCFEKKRTSGKWENFLPPSPGRDGTQLAIWVHDQENDDGIRLSGRSWRTTAIENIGPDEDVRHNIEYKLHLYWEQEGKCKACQRTIWFDHMEMDRLMPGAEGGRYVVGNVQLFCPSCNKIKGERGIDFLLERLKGRGKLGS